MISVMLEISLAQCPNKTKFCHDIQIITSSISDLTEVVRENDVLSIPGDGWHEEEQATIWISNS